MQENGSQKLRVAVFDLDGTLVELDHEHFAQQIGVTLSKMGVYTPPKDEILRLIVGHRLSTLFAGDGEQRRFWSLYEEGEIPPPRLFERSLHTIEEVVQRGLNVAIATARKVHHEELRRHLRESGLLKHVQCIATFHETNWTDKVEQLRRVCKEHSVEPRLAMMAGDSEDDMRSAWHLGFGLRIGLESGITPVERLKAHRPHRVLPGIAEVPSAIDEHHAVLAESAVS